MASALYSTLADTVDTFTDELKHVISSTLNGLAPLTTVTHVTETRHQLDTERTGAANDSHTRQYVTETRHQLDT